MLFFATVGEINTVFDSSVGKKSFFTCDVDMYCNFWYYLARQILSNLAAKEEFL